MSQVSDKTAWKSNEDIQQANRGEYAIGYTVHLHFDES